MYLVFEASIPPDMVDIVKSAWEGIGNLVGFELIGKKGTNINLYRVVFKYRYPAGAFRLISELRELDLVKVRWFPKIGGNLITSLDLWNHFSRWYDNSLHKDYPESYSFKSYLKDIASGKRALGDAPMHDFLLELVEGELAMQWDSVPTYEKHNK